MERRTVLALSLLVLAVGWCAAGAAQGPDGRSVYARSCAACHAVGVSGAPKLGDSDAWGARLAGGYDRLVVSALRGKGAMPPKGGNAGLTDGEVVAAVDYMIAAAARAEQRFGAGARAPAVE
jgi:cytochrome c5